MKFLPLFIFFVVICSGNCSLLQNYTANPEQLIKSVLDKVNSNELELSLDCVAQLLEFLGNLASFSDGLWALRMIDATAKVPAGIAKINWAWLGNYDECLEISNGNRDVLGSYCLISINIEGYTTMEMKAMERHRLIAEHKRLGKEFSNVTVASFLPAYGVCIPNKCAGENLQAIINIFDGLTSIPFDIMCQSKEDKVELDQGGIITIAFFGAIIAIMVLSTLYDTYCQFHKQAKPHPILASFSVYTNGKKLFHATEKTDLSCLNGIRFLSIMWVVLGHMMSLTASSALDNVYDLYEFVQGTRSLFYVNGTLSVDSFFFLSGFLLVFVFMKAMKSGTKFNIIYFYVHRYIRLTVPFIPVILFFAFLVKYLGSGPLYPELDASLGHLCRKNWWKSLLYIQNYFVPYELCNQQTWYLNVDWQLYLVSPIMLYFLYKLPLIGIHLVCITSLASMAASFFITRHYQLPALLSNLRNLVDYNTKYYMQTYTRAAPYLIGAIVGYYISKVKIYKEIDFNKTPRIIIYSIWVIVLTVMPVCVFGGVDQLNNLDYDVVANSLYNTFVRPTWAVCLGWIVIACSNGYGGIINSILSLPILQILSRFTYSIYMLHLGIAYIVNLNVRSPIHFTEFNMLYSFWPLFMLTFGLSIFWVLAFESPIVVLDKYLSGRGRSKSNDQHLKQVKVGNS
ncbi:nose resistant to fluoxetine protein 6-like [Sitophilus oryzae]|uniref:Nose resistant to fluoxetine protein 6-like n=1 Tax=Sitophilus oryzae TaxID=7048 RepID=A0A6J2Y143_SITOR|nr:nose resistant to fluoxetine protein 6-like [Sitophilus oryzae]